jgi:hypothetical protein
MAGIFDLDFKGLMEGFGILAKDVRVAITGKEPIDENKVSELAIKLKELENVIPTLVAQVDVAQANIDTAEAQSGSMFKSGWRPAAGWICVLAMGYNYIIMPLVVWIARFFTPNAPPMLNLESGELMTLLFGMLGLGGLRTYEKIKK